MSRNPGYATTVSGPMDERLSLCFRTILYGFDADVCVC